MGCGSSVSRYREADEEPCEECDGPPGGPLAVTAAARAPVGARVAPGWRPAEAAAAAAWAQPPAAAAPTTAPGRPAAAAAAGEWQLERSPGVWSPLPADRSLSLLEAYYAGESRVVYTAPDGATCEVDFGTCVHSDWRTGAQVRLRWASAPSAAARQPAAAAPSQSGMYDAAYQWQLKNGAWVDFEDEEQHDLLLAWRSGKNVYRYAARGLEYEVDFQWMRQTNLCTKHARSIRVRVHEDPCADIAGTLGAVPQKEPEWDTYWHIGGERRQLDGPAAAEPPEPPGAAGAPLPAAEPAASRGPPHARGAGAATAGGGGPGAAAPAGRHKKHSLRPGGHPAAPPRPDQRTAGAAAGAPGAPAGAPRGAAGAGRPPPPGAAAPEAGPAALPDGASWPVDAGAREAAAALFAQLASTRPSSSTAERRGLYRAQCLVWHPDKNPDREDLATEVFQFLQLLRGWYLQP